MSGRSLGRLSCIASMLLSPCVFSAPARTGAQTVPVHLQVEAGTPLRLYITKRLPYRLGDPVQAKFAEAVWAFDRVVIPAGTVVNGRVSDLEPVSKIVRAMAMIRGDFTPLKIARVSFTTMTLPNGKSVDLGTEPSVGLDSIFDPKQASKSKKKNKPPKDPNSKSAQLLRFVKQQAQAQANARTRGMIDLVRTPNKREWLENFMWAKLPYHPQSYRAGTRFDAVLERPIDFGEVSIAASKLREMGTQPPSDSPALVRFLSTVDSADGHVGDPVTGELSQPLFSAGHQLVLPEGTRLTGKITLVHHARMFHRGGQLRFAFDDVKVPKIAGLDAPQSEPAQAQLTAAEELHGSIKVDSEGTAKATESKTRFLRPVIAGLIAAKSMDNDTGKQAASGTANANPVGSSLGGFSGFGLFGTVISRFSPSPVGAVFGYYGLGWSVYSTVVSRGREVTFSKNAAMAIRFGAPERHH